MTAGNYPNFPLILEQGTQLSVITAHHGLEHTAKILGLIINDFCGGFNVVRPMTGDQLADLAIELAMEYWHYRLEDFVVFFALCKKEVYDRILDRLDPGTIQRMLKLYNAQRADALLHEQHSIKAHEIHVPRITPEDSGVMRVAGSFMAIGDIAAQNHKKIIQLDPDKNGKGK